MKKRYQIFKGLLTAVFLFLLQSASAYDGNLQIDNNLVEKAIRPVSLGRKITSSQKAMKLHSVQH